MFSDCSLEFGGQCAYFCDVLRHYDSRREFSYLIGQAALQVPKCAIPKCRKQIQENPDAVLRVFEQGCAVCAVLLYHSL